MRRRWLFGVAAVCAIFAAWTLSRPLGMHPATNMKESNLVGGSQVAAQPATPSAVPSLVTPRIAVLATLSSATSSTVPTASMRPTMSTSTASGASSGAVHAQPDGPGPDQPPYASDSVLVLLFREEAIDDFWGAGTARRWEKVAGEGCRLVASCTYTLDVGAAPRVDGILFPVGRPNREPLRARWLPLDMKEVKDENPKVPVAIMVTEADEPPAPAAYAHRYDLRISYTRDADIVHGQACDMRVLTSPGLSSPGGAREARPRPKLVASFISNCGAGVRDKLLQELMTVVPVDNYGACFHNVDSPVTRGSSNWVAVKEGILSDYVFAIAFENKIAEDYVTEKVFNALKVGAIPVYFGAPNVEEFLPSPGCIVNAANFASGQDLGAHLLAVSSNSTLLASYHSWSTEDVQRLLQRHGCADSPYCQFCEHCAYRRRAGVVTSGNGSAGLTVPTPLGGNKRKGLRQH